MQLSIRVFTPTIWHYCTFVPQKTYASEVEEKHWQKSRNNLTNSSSLTIFSSLQLLSPLCIDYISSFFLSNFLFLVSLSPLPSNIFFLWFFKASLNFQVASFNPGQNIWHKVKRYYKTGQDFKNIISNFACFLTAIANV